MSGTFVIESDSGSAKLACCIIAFVFVFILMIGAICWTNCENFENFSDVMKYNNDTIKNVLGGGTHYKALSQKDDVLMKFKSMDKSNKVALVAVLAPWCGYCKRLKESGELRKIAKKFNVLILDDKHPQVNDVMHLLQAEGFPALGIYHQGQLMPYRGERTSKMIMSTMEDIYENTKSPKMMPHNSPKHSHMKEGVMVVPKDLPKRDYEMTLSQMVSKGNKVCTLFMADWCGHCKNLKESGIVEKLVDQGIIVMKADDETILAKEMKIQGFPTIYCGKPKR